MESVKPKKHLGQHFLKDKSIALNIVSLLDTRGCKNVLEIGPGTGVLTVHLLENKEINFKAIDIDVESIAFLKTAYPNNQAQFILGDFLKMRMEDVFNGEPFSIIGNFPYNISSQILFKVFENHVVIPQLVGMFQKEVAQRVASGPGTKDYGILSVLLQAFYNFKYEFTVNENVFDPPPKVKSGVISMLAKENTELACDVKDFKMVIKTAFNQRRKTLRNSLRSITRPDVVLPENISKRRPEELSVKEFVELTKLLYA